MDNSNFGAWGTPQGGFNWNMLANVGAGMLANSQYSPGQAFGKGYEQASANSLEQAKAGLLFQDAEQKRQQYKIHKEAMKALMTNPLMNGQGGGQPPPTAGNNVGMPVQQGAPLNAGDAPMHEVPMLQAPQAQGGMGAAQPQQGGGQPGDFDTNTFNQLVTLSAKLKSLGEDDAAQAAMSKATAMKTLYDVDNARRGTQIQQGQLDVARGGLQNQQRQTDLQAQKQKYDMNGGEEPYKRYRAIQDSGLQAQSRKTTLEQMDRDAQAKGFYSGAGGYSVLQLKRLGHAMGIKGIEGISSTEQFNALSAQSLMDKANGSLGNQISNGDREVMNQTIAYLGNTPEGNRAIMEFQMKMANREIEVAKMAREYKKGHGSLDEGWDEQLAQFKDDNSMFNQGGGKDPLQFGPAAPAGLPAAGVQGGGATTPPASAAPSASWDYDQKTGDFKQITPTQAPPPPAEYPAPGTQWPPMLPPAQPAAAGAQPGWMQKMFGGQ